MSVYDPNNDQKDIQLNKYVFLFYDLDIYHIHVCL